MQRWPAPEHFRHGGDDGKVLDAGTHRAVEDRPTMADPWPQTIRITKDRQSLVVEWDDGRRDELAAELLRVESPSAEVQGHNASQKVIVAGKKDVAITGAEPVGTYAVRLVFSDGHDSGLYTWPNLRAMAEQRDSLWAAYLAALEERGLSR
jgi:DUF971 family protein